MKRKLFIWSGLLALFGGLNILGNLWYDVERYGIESFSRSHIWLMGIMGEGLTCLGLILCFLGFTLKIGKNTKFLLFWGGLFLFGGLSSFVNLWLTVERHYGPQIVPFFQVPLVIVISVGLSIAGFILCLLATVTSQKATKVS